MLITNTITKKILENIVYETFLNFGNLSSSQLLDSLKFLGFSYATNAGISIAIEDLKTPNSKKEFLNKSYGEIIDISRRWRQGFVSDNERFQSIIDSWNFATESLKNRIIDYYENYDPANNLYIMAFSGARGNMSQVRQLVGMRGLMSDQEGRIIDLPIQTNFREGLSSIDYIISSYGARKGIVDTALKTADSGYLTRRLIYIAQDFSIRESDCYTKTGAIILAYKNGNMNNIIGRTIISIKKNNNLLEQFSNSVLNHEIISQLKKISPVFINIRTPLTCNSNGSICQKCYGWDLSKNRVISLGEAVGILAAQSIGEPGTQLTMRTFHTGGIFTSEMLKQILAPFSGKVLVPKGLKAISYRSNHGIKVLKLQQEVTLSIINWKGIKKDLFLEIGSFLYISTSGFVKKNQLISEFSTNSFSSGSRKLKPIYSYFSGEIRFESLVVRSIFRNNKSTVKVNQANGTLWLSSGKIISLPKEIKKNFKSKLLIKKSLANLKIISPYDGIIIFEKSFIYIAQKEKKIKLDFSWITKKLKNYNIEFVPFLKNYQFLDKNTLLGMLYIFPKIEEKVYKVKKKESKYFSTFLFITESDVWKLNIDQLNTFRFSKTKGVRLSNSLSETIAIKKSGFLLKKDGFQLIFQNSIPMFLSHGTILNCKKGDFVSEKESLATLVNYIQQTEDIIQGLPKIEELIEARIPKNKSYLSIKPAIILNPTYLRTFKKIGIESNMLNYFSIKGKYLEKTKKEKREKQTIQLLHSFYFRDNIVVFENNLWKIIPLPLGFEPKAKRTKFDFYFKNKSDQILLMNGKLMSSTWSLKTEKIKDFSIFKYEKENLKLWKKLKNKTLVYENKKGDYIIKDEKSNYLFLELINPISEYQLPINIKILHKPGDFIDLGEPITEGILDPHELLLILFRYHSKLDGLGLGSLRSLNKFQILVVNSIQSIYQSQGVNISSKHIEIIIRQMTSRVIIKESGDTPLLPGEIIRFSLIHQIENLFLSNTRKKKYKTAKYEPLFLSSTNSSLNKDGFLSAAGFQETKRVLSKAAIEGTNDWLRGLKECVITGRLIAAGSAFLNYKNYLDNIYFYKKYNI